MPVRNVVFDAGGVLLEWNPPRVIAQLYPDPQVQAQIRQYIFEHPDWHEFDRGTLTAEARPHTSPSSPAAARRKCADLLRVTAESLHPIDGTIRLLEELAAAQVNLYLLSNMPVSTYEILSQRHAFFEHFAHLVISGAILHAQARTGDLQAPGRDNRHRAGRERVHRRPERNVIAARECGLHAIQFTTPAGLPRGAARLSTDTRSCNRMNPP